MSAARAIGLLLGVVADGAIGDPRRGRPGTGLATVAAAARNRLYADHPAPGIAYAGTLAGGAVLAGVLVERVGRRHPLLQVAGTAAATWSVLGGARLVTEGTELARDLETGDLDSARGTLSTLDGRSTEDLDVPALSRASVETVAGQTSAAVVSPLVWGAIAGVPGLLGSRAVTLARAAAEPRVPRYRRFGWVAARLDELVGLLPTRVAALLTVTGAPVVGGSANRAWEAWHRDTVVHPSPNEGRVEAAFAGALEIRLGGRTVYPHGVEEQPVLGNGRNPDAGHVTRAVELSRVVGWLAGATSAALALTLGLRRR
ncbi:cobalamin biosynthesis protein CobD/CbiB [Prauserella cavernicola]|uniref:Cobalamin biosynthesis protein CobD n=1 Tax=Prauserella cavernicola TaxID=2800127 RepID=A0A934V522_9PSEU|nr:cobalamin biosynthesis protein [Prauserella cavernicola]MBK1788981.1 cobalamin biosynthesis protein [Prauserella cavernicola]